MQARFQQQRLQYSYDLGTKGKTKKKRKTKDFLETYG